MSIDVIGYVIAGIFTFAGAVVVSLMTARNNRRVTDTEKEKAEAEERAEERKADAEAYMRARQIDIGVVRELTEDHARLSAEVRKLRAELDEERKHREALERQLADERRKVTALARQINQGGASSAGGL